MLTNNGGITIPELFDWAELVAWHEQLPATTVMQSSGYLIEVFDCTKLISEDFICRIEIDLSMSPQKIGELVRSAIEQHKLLDQPRDDERPTP